MPSIPRVRRTGSMPSRIAKHTQYAQYAPPLDSTLPLHLGQPTYWVWTHDEDGDNETFVLLMLIWMMMMMIIILMMMMMMMMGPMVVQTVVQGQAQGRAHGIPCFGRREKRLKAKGKSLKEEEWRERRGGTRRGVLCSWIRTLWSWIRIEDRNFGLFLVWQKKEMKYACHKV